ncbi:uncharacterized protein JCM6883_000769 [Sporobolomyces salmoneus]|uniref:uncharacterized protein n=1 Tax=Sporobolomyces salmoneus TaxID=183962 RepID=UPI00317FFEC2
MRSFTTITALSALASTAYGFVYTVGVGKDQTTGQPGVGFDPSRTVISDLTTDNEVHFRFLQGNHRVVQSDFDSPCASNGGFDSGEENVATGTAEESGPVATFNIANNSGVYYFSDIGNNAAECYLGAVFCLNTNEADDATACHSFQAAALALGAQNGVTANSTTSTAASIPSTASSTSAASSSTSGSASTTSSGTRSQSTSAAPSQSAAGGTSGAGHIGISTIGGIFAGVVGIVGAVAF